MDKTYRFSTTDQAARWRSLGVCVLGLIFSYLIPCETVSAEGRAVDLELVIAVDISGSVDDDEAALQRQGYINAFRDPQIVKAIKTGYHGAIAATYYEWAGAHHQQALVKWMVVHDEASALDFAAALAFEPVTINVWTSISGMLDAGRLAIESNAFNAKRRVIDISGDGANNDGLLVTDSRARALATGLTINGLPIVNDRLSRYGRRQIPNLDFYYTDCVIGGPGAFIIVANGYADYARAVRRKLILEIAGAVPATTPKAHRANSHQPAEGIVLVRSDVRAPCDVGENLRQDWDDY